MKIPKWKRKEKKDAKDFGGKTNRGSGNFWSAPGDVKTDKYLLDSKFTKKQSYSISIKTWDKLYEEALFSYRIPILSLQLQDVELIVMSKQDFLNEIKKRAHGLDRK